MGKTRKKEQHIAVFGESGSGKTVLLSSFFGAAQELAHDPEVSFRVTADDAGQRQYLLQNFYKMRDSQTAPLQNRFRAVTYKFSLKLKESIDRQERKARPFDALSIVWHDYPGEWFEQEASGETEAARREETFRSLLSSDVALLLVDGQKLLDNAGQEERYLKSLFTNFREGLLASAEDVDQGGKPLEVFPRIWMIALSKADLLPHMTASAFKALVIEKAAEDLAALREMLSGIVMGQDALSVGEDFVVLSSAKFEDQQIKIDERLGLELIVPLASILPFERHVRWAQKKEIPRTVAQNLLEGTDEFGANAMAIALLGSKYLKLPGPFSAISNLLATLVTKEVMEDASNLVGEKLREVNRKASEQKQLLTTILTQFKMDLEKGEADDILRRDEP